MQVADQEIKGLYRYSTDTRGFLALQTQILLGNGCVLGALRCGLG